LVPGSSPGGPTKLKGSHMLGRGLLTLAVAVAVVALVFHSVPAAITAGLLGVFGAIAKGLE